MNSAHQLQVFVSCPRDVSDEKNEVKQICDRLRIDFLPSRVDFIFREWPQVYGEIGVDAQSSINTDIHDYDIYIGIMWMRFGTPTNNINPATRRPYQSGTEEEFELAFQRKTQGENIRINFFFKKPDLSSPDKHPEQMAQVEQFRKRVESLGMRQEFEKIEDFSKLVTHHLNQVGLGLVIEKMEKLKFEESQQLSTIIYHLKESALRNIEELVYYIPRQVMPIKEWNDTSPQLFSESEYPKLNDLVITSKRIVLLANAGTGKSIELQQLALEHTKEETPFIPIYKRFNSYIDEDIKDFLPSGWEAVNHEILLLLFDGLDEVQSAHVNTAVRKIEAFSEKYPLVTIVVSCRTNFYQLPTHSTIGTLNQFECYFLQDLGTPDIQAYVTDIFNLEGKKFIEEVFEKGFQDLVTKPFFLNILIAEYAKKGNLNAKRSDIIQQFLYSRIRFDQEHFRTTVGETSKEEIVDLLQKVALTMEVLGRNYISTAELRKIVPERLAYDSLKYFSAFNKKGDNDGNWSFEHNNIQEYLAASMLNGKNFTYLKKFISFEPSFSKVKPSWVNTLSFLISICERSQADAVIEWLLQTEPEIIIKFEKDRVDGTLRNALLQRIFNYYKEKEIWLSSNKFNDQELARFAESVESISFLISELEDTSNSSMTKLNAMSVLKYIDFSNHPRSLERLKEILIYFVKHHNGDNNLVYHTLRAMSLLHLHDQPIVHLVIHKLGGRRNQYIRAGIYKLIGDSGLVNENIDIFLEGVCFMNERKRDEDRDAITLADESFLLRQGLKRADSVDAIQKILEFFKDPLDQRHMGFYDKEDILEKIIQKATGLYASSKQLYDPLLEMLIHSEKISHSKYKLPLIQFFENTVTKRRAFHDVFSNTKLSDFEKGSLVGELIDKETVDEVVIQFVWGDLTNEQIIELDSYLRWHWKKREGRENMIEYLEQEMLKVSGPRLERDPQPDWQAVNQQKTQKSFDLLFEKDEVKKEVAIIFTETGKVVIRYQELWDIRRNSRDGSDHSFAEVAMDVLRALTSDRDMISREAAINWVDSKGFTIYQIQQIQQYHKNNPTINLTSSHLAFIQDWCNQKASSLNWNKLVYNNSEDGYARVSNSGALLWYFVDQLNMDLDPEQVLNFSLFDTMYNQESSKSIFKRIEEIVGIHQLNERIVRNLIQGIPVTLIWKNNALEALRRNLTQAYPAILNGLKDDIKSEMERRDVLTAYFEKTDNEIGLKEMLDNTGSALLQMEIINLLMPKPEEKQFLVPYLKTALQSGTETGVPKLITASQLTELGDMAGLEYYVDYLVKKNDPSEDSHGLSFLSKITSIEALPSLLKLLQLTKTPAFVADSFNFMESSVISAFHSIGLFSEDNLKKLKQEIILFIEAYASVLPNLRYLYLTLDKIEDQFYINKSRSYTTEEAIALMGN